MGLAAGKAYSIPLKGLNNKEKVLAVWKTCFVRQVQKVQVQKTAKLLEYGVALPNIMLCAVVFVDETPFSAIPLSLFASSIAWYNLHQLSETAAFEAREYGTLQDKASTLYRRVQDDTEIEGYCMDYFRSRTRQDSGYYSNCFNVIVEAEKRFDAEFNQY